jgi:lipoprotein-anchoring transpeptidase ErfK/SrfK
VGLAGASKIAEDGVRDRTTTAAARSTGRLRRRHAVGALLGAAAVLVAGCGPSHNDTASATSAARAASTGQVESSHAKITVEPADGAERIEPTAPVRVRVDSGKITEIKVTDARGRNLHGDLGDGATSWQASEVLRPNATYTAQITAEDDHGRTTTTSSTFRTVRADKLLRTSVVPLNGETVGVGQPIGVNFNGTVGETYRPVVERALKVTSTPAVLGSWHWINGREIRYRPEEYWPGDTKVRFDIRLTGLKVGASAYGAESRTIRFTVGRSMVSVVDIARHRMTVYRRDKLARVIPISTGKKGFETRGGTKIVLEKTKHKVMDATSIGIPKDSPDYYHLDVFWAVRVTWSGEFLHAAPWSVGAQGHANVSHGCVGMSDANAEWFFNNSMRGDVVRVVGNKRKPMELDNGYGDWNVSWPTWKAGSALD